MRDAHAINPYAAFALAALYHARPNYVCIVPSRIVAALGHVPTTTNIFLCQTAVIWLCDNKYIVCRNREVSRIPGVTETTFVDSRLAAVGHGALKFEVELEGTKERASTILLRQLRDRHGLERDAIVSAVMTRIIESASRAFFN